MIVKISLDTLKNDNTYNMSTKIAQSMIWTNVNPKWDHLSSKRFLNAKSCKKDISILMLVLRAQSTPVKKPTKNKVIINKISHLFSVKNLFMLSLKQLFDIQHIYILLCMQILYMYLVTHKKHHYLSTLSNNL